jgi:hypothetical protein
MRILLSVAVFVGSFIVMTIACTWGWDTFINNKLYNCTDGGGPDYCFPVIGFTILSQFLVLFEVVP